MVERAIAIAESAAEEFPDKKVYTLGRLAHNDRVSERLSKKGISVALSPEELTAGDVLVISAHGAPPSVYEASANAPDDAAWRELFRRSRAQDKLLRATQKGPHRDDFRFRIFSRAAEDFASEGQQRGMTLSLGLAQLALFRDRLGVAPVVLADDVLGELDEARRAGFWAAVGSGLQVFATGTRPPDDAGAWRIFTVEAGTYRG